MTITAALQSIQKQAIKPAELFIIFSKEVGQYLRVFTPVEQEDGSFLITMPRSKTLFGIAVPFTQNKGLFELMIGNRLYYGLPNESGLTPMKSRQTVIFEREVTRNDTAGKPVDIVERAVTASSGDSIELLYRGKNQITFKVK